MSRKQEIFVVNSLPMNSTNTRVDIVLARLRGDTPEILDPVTGEMVPNPDYDGRTVKLPPHLFAGNLPLPGEAFSADFDPASLQGAGPRYRVLRNAKVAILSQGDGSAPAPAAAEGHTEEAPHPAETGGAESYNEAVDTAPGSEEIPF